MQQRGAHIEFNHVGLTYGKGDDALEALRDVTLNIAAGESVALIGPSGCGKSTTLHLVAGLLTPTEGAVLVDGAQVDAPLRTTAFIQQDLGLFPWKTVLQNAALGLAIRKAPQKEANERAKDALAKVGLAGFERSYPKDLSGGMRQRLALARALAMEANLLLMDEPLSAIDALLRESLQDDLLQLWVERGHTQMLVTHSIEEAVYLGQRIIVFSNRPARVVAEIGNPSMGSPAYRSTAEFLDVCQKTRVALATCDEGGQGAHALAPNRGQSDGPGNVQDDSLPSHEGGVA